MRFEIVTAGSMTGHRTARADTEPTRADCDGFRAPRVVFSYGGVAHFSGDDSISERPLPLAGCASLRAAGGRAYVDSLRERLAPFEFPPDVG